MIILSIFLEIRGLRFSKPSLNSFPIISLTCTLNDSKLGTGLKQLLAGVRKFKLNLICRDDIAYISDTAGIVCNKWDLGIHSQEDLDFELVKKEIYSRKW